jgi:hypothetical protein
MGRIDSSLEAANDLTVVTVVGEVDVGQVLSQIITLLTGEPTQLVLWDIRAGSLAGISRDELRMIVEEGAPYADRRRGGRTAVVCSKEVDYGISRMFQAFASLGRIPFEIEVFRDIRGAREWLNSGERGSWTGAI